MFSKNINLKVNIIVRLLFELTHYNIAVQHISNHATFLDQASYDMSNKKKSLLSIKPVMICLKNSQKRFTSLDQVFYDMSNQKRLISQNQTYCDNTVILIKYRSDSPSKLLSAHIVFFRSRRQINY